MAKRPDLSGHQKKIVNRYYEHRDTIAANKLAEVVSELYVSTDEKKAARLWKSAETALRNLGVPEAEISRVVGARDVKGLAGLVGKV